MPKLRCVKASIVSGAMRLQSSKCAHNLICFRYFFSHKAHGPIILIWAMHLLLGF